MANRLPPPAFVDEDLEFFLWAWARDEMTCAMTLPNGRSYDLGSADETRRYFRDVLKLGGICGFGERALNCATNWPVVMVIPATEQCYAADTVEGDKVMGSNLFGEKEAEKDEVILLGISPGLPSYV
jgi:hypothetical protein